MKNEPEIRSKSVLVVLNYYCPYVSGLTLLAKEMAEGLVQRLDRVTVLTIRHDDKLPEEEVINGVRVIRCKKLLNLHKGVLSLDFVTKFCSISGEYSYVHMHLPMLEAGLFAKLCRSRRIFVSYHCDVAPVGGFIDWLATKIVLMSAKVAVSKCEKVIVTSLDYAKGSEVLGKEGKFVTKIVEIAPPVKFCYDSDYKYFSNVGVFKIGFVGRFVREKGIEVLLKALEICIGSGCRMCLYLVGDYQSVAGGSVYKEIEHMINSLGCNVTVFGKLSEVELVEFYNSIDVLVLPSINSYEAFGIVQLEAMYRGVPVVASNMKGVRVPVLLTGNGLLFEMGNSDDLAKKILKLYNQETTFSRSVIVARTKEHFEYQKLQEKYWALFND